MPAEMVRPEEERVEPFRETVDANGDITVDSGPMPQPDAFEKDFVSKSAREDKLKELVEVFAQVREWRESNVDPVWQRAVNVYNGVISCGNPYTAYYAPREAYKIVEVAKALDEQLLPADAFEYETLVEGGEEDAIAATAIVKQQLREFDLDQQIDRWRDERRIYGVSYLLVGWAKYAAPRTMVYKKVSPGQTIYERTIQAQEHGGPYVRWVSPTCIYTMPDTEDIRLSPYVFMVEQVSGATLKMEVQNKTVDRKETLKYIRENDGNQTESERHQIDQPEFDLQDWINPLKEYEMMTVWTNDGMEYVMLDRKVLVRATESLWGFAPLLCARINTVGGQHYGYPDPIVVEADSLFMADVNSAAVDAIHYTTNPMFSVSERLRNEWDLVSFKPGGTIYRQDKDDVTLLSPAPAIPANLFDFGERARQSMGNVLGVNDQIAGQAGHRTATGTDLLQKAASARLGFSAQILKPEWRKLFWMLYDLNARYLDRVYPIRIPAKVGQEVFRHIGPESFSRPIAVKVNLNLDSESGQEKRAKSLQLWQLVRDDNRFNHQLVQLDVAKSFGIENPRALIADPTAAQLDAIRAILAWRATGVMPNALPHDNHEIFAFLIQQEMAGPTFMAATESAQNNLKDAMEWHQGYLQQQLGAAGAGVQTPGGGGAGAGGSYDQSGNKMGAGMGSDMAEGMMGNAMTGAAQNAPL